MKLHLSFDIPPNSKQFTHRDQFLLIGSCFSDEIGKHFIQNGFRAEINPFGTLFHPTAIANVLKSSIDQLAEVRIHQRDDLFFSWDAASKIYAFSEAELMMNVIEVRRKLRNHICQSSMLVITFGTAWQYELNEEKIVVGNCHKAPQHLFSKTLTSVEEMRAQWKPLIAQLKRVNPTLEIVLTVSPVRHVKDGIVENNRSKSRLIELVHALVDEYKLTYFPSYEILIDELRDYRFYQSDLVHPSDEAVKYVWERWTATFFATPTAELVRKIAAVQQALEHQSIHPGSKADKERVRSAIEQKKKLSQDHPEICWK